MSLLTLRVRLLSSAVWVCLMLATACGELRYVDPPVTFAEREARSTWEGPPLLQLGFYEEQIFVALPETEATMPLIWGFQGGTWTMPAIRFFGLGPVCDIDTRISLVETGEEVGVLSSSGERFILAPDGAFEQQSVPIPILHAPPREGDPIDDLYGLEAEWRVELRCGALGELSALRRVSLVEG